MKASAKHLLPKLDRSCAAPKGALPCAPCRERVARRILLEVAPVLTGVKPAALLSLEDGECGAYTHTASAAQRGDKFVGLALDEMNEADKTADRIAAWTAQVKAEAGV